MLKSKMQKIVGVTILAIILGFITYKQTHLTIWDFKISKSELNSVIVYTEEGTYSITDKNDVLAIAKELSQMDKSSMLDPAIKRELSNGKYKKILIKTDDNTTYGGSIWEGNSLDSNGYYWVFVDEEIENLLNTTVANANQLP
jgi:hypothetical protein